MDYKFICFVMDPEDNIPVEWSNWQEEGAKVGQRESGH